MGQHSQTLALLHTKEPISMQSIILGVGELGASRTPGSEIKTYALGSCVAVVLYDAANKVAGMVHVALPDSTINTKRAEELPGYFADTGIASLIKSLGALRGMPGGKGLTARITGGANVMKAQAAFNIGERNIVAVRKELGKYSLTPVREDVGGNISRTVSVDLNGQLMITSPGRGQWML